LYEKLLNWKETDPKQYWQVLNSLKKGDNSSKNPEIQVNVEKIIEHFKSQGSCKNYNVNLKNKVENHIIQYKNLLTDISITDKPFTISEIKQCINILKSNKASTLTIMDNLIKFFFKWNFYLMETLIHIRKIFSIQIKFLKDI
jgi:hypothetical protein